MPIQFRCSSCTAPIEVDDHIAGQTAQCPYCGRLVSVPANSTIEPSVVVTARPSGTPGAAPSSASGRRFGGYSLILAILVVVLYGVATFFTPATVRDWASQDPTSRPSMKEMQDSMSKDPATVWLFSASCAALAFAALGVVFGLLGVSRDRREWRGWLGLLLCGAFLLLAVGSGIYLQLAHG